MAGSTSAGLSPNDPNKYLGPNVALSLVVMRNRSPTGADYRMPETGKLYPINTFWIVGKNPTTGIQGDMWYLSKIVANVGYWVQLNAASALSLSVQVQAATAPGTTPVIPTAGGLLTVNGAAVANHSVPVETRTRALNTFNLEVQYSASAAATDATKSGLSHFNSTQFSVDANGFVSLTGGGGGSGINVVQTQVFTSSGTYTPTAGMVYAQIEVVGSGGGGGGSDAVIAGQFGAAGGGGGGEYALGIFDAATIGASQTVTINAAGAGGVGLANGGNGGSVSVGALISANGGLGGTQGGSTAASGFTLGGAGGTGGAGGSTRFPGNYGGDGYISSPEQTNYGGSGGGSRYSGGVRNNVSTGANGTNGNGYGGGGSGATNKAINPARNGGSGTDGLVFITEYIIM